MSLRRSDSEMETRSLNRDWIFMASEAELRDVAFWLNAADPHTFAAAVADNEEEWE